MVENMYRIGEFSKMTKTTVKTLRYYDEMGLLRPEFVDAETGYRYYTTSQLMPLHGILALRQAGLSVNEVKRALSGEDPVQILLSRKAEIEWEMQRAAEQLSRIQSILQHYKEESLMNYQAILKDLPACTVYYKQGVVPDFAAYTQFILQSADECRAANPDLKCIEPDYCFVAYLDPEYREKNIHIEYVQAVERAGKETDTIRFRELSSVPAVCVFHKGSYDHLREAYAFAYQWIEENGYLPAESAREHYIDGMWNRENPGDWLTEIQIPVRKK